MPETITYIRKLADSLENGGDIKQRQIDVLIKLLKINGRYDG